MAQWLKTGNMTARQGLDLPPFWLMGGIVLVWLQVWLWPGATMPVPLLQTLGSVLFWGALAVMGWTIWTFRSHQTTVVPHQVPARIITTGPFAFSRNPIYLADVILLLGVILRYGAWPALVLVPLLAVILLRRFIAPEEARMKQNFGQEFDAYAAKTRRWL